MDVLVYYRTDRRRTNRQDQVSTSYDDVQEYIDEPNWSDKAYSLHPDTEKATEKELDAAIMDILRERKRVKAEAERQRKEWDAWWRENPVNKANKEQHMRDRMILKLQRTKDDLQNSI